MERLGFVDLALTQDDRAFRNRLRAWLDANWGPPRRESAFSDEAHTLEERVKLRRDFGLILYRDGFGGLSWDPAYGGRGGSLTQQLIFWQECARAGAPDPINRSALGTIGPALMMFGTEEQRQLYLERILACSDIWCQGFSEPNAGSDLAGLQTRARKTHGGWEITGQKTWTTLAQFADYCFLLARTDPDKPKHKGITAFIVPMHQPGVEIRPIRQINESNEFSDVFFDCAVVSDDHVLGGIDEGWRVAMTALSHERSVNFLMFRHVELSQLVERLVGERIEMATTDDEAVPHGLIDVVIANEALRYSVYAQMTQLEEGQEPGPESNASKVYWSDAYQRLTQLATDLIPLDGGSAGAHYWARQYLSARAATIYGGSSEIQLTIVAERALGLPR